MSTFLPQDSNDNPIPVLRLKDGGAHSVSASSGSSARNTAAFDSATRVVSIYSDTDVHLKFGDAGVSATTSDHFFPAGVYYDFAIGGETSGHNTHVAVIAASSGGTVYISERS